MKVLLLSMLLPFVVLAGCTDKEAKKSPEYLGKEPPRECINYRQMMTAPIAPQALENLKKKCAESMAK